MPWPAQRSNGRCVLGRVGPVGGRDELVEQVGLDRLAGWHPGRVAQLGRVRKRAGVLAGTGVVDGAGQAD
jgi:hypothetical protein